LGFNGLTLAQSDLMSDDITLGFIQAVNRP